MLKLLQLEDVARYHSRARGNVAIFNNVKVMWFDLGHGHGYHRYFHVNGKHEDAITVCQAEALLSD
jgi:hypothetical protein